MLQPEGHHHQKGLHVRVPGVIVPRLRPPRPPKWRKDEPAQAGARAAVGGLSRAKGYSKDLAAGDNRRGEVSVAAATAGVSSRGLESPRSCLRPAVPAPPTGGSVKDSSSEAMRNAEKSGQAGLPTQPTYRRLHNVAIRRPSAPVGAPTTGVGPGGARSSM
jgi:hypothetical protein